MFILISEHLLFFTDISQLVDVKTKNPALLKQRRLVTGEMSVAFELENLGIEFIDIWNFLSPEDIEKNKNKARKLAENWVHEYLSSCESKDLVVTDTTQEDLVYPFEAALNAITAYGRLFNEYAIEKISVYLLPSIALIRTGPRPTSRAAGSVALAVLVYMAEKRNIKIDRLAPPLPICDVRKISLSNVINSFSNSTISIKEIEESSEVERLIIVYENGMPLSERAGLLKAFNKLPNVKVISISRDIIEMNFEMPVLQTETNRKIELFWNKFLVGDGDYYGKYPEIFGNKYLLFQFERIKQELQAASILGDRFNLFLELLKPSLVVFGHEAFTIERTLVRAAQNRKIATVGLIHSGLGHKASQKGVFGDVDNCFVWNRIDMDWQSSFGVQESRLIQVGCLRYESEYIKYNSEKNDFTTKKASAKVLLGLNKEKPLITILTAEINTGLCSSIANPRMHREALRDFFTLVKSRSDLQFVIKAHPSYDYLDIYREMLKHKLPNLIFNEKLTLTEVLDASDICILLNYCTTAALEAMLHKIPVLYFNNAIYPLSDWQDSFTYVGGSQIATMNELIITIDELLTNPVIKKEALAKADEQLKIFMGIEELSPTNRLLYEINRVLDNQENINMSGLSGKNELRNFLYSHEDRVMGHQDDLFMKHSPESLMRSLAYLAGTFNVGSSSIPRIFRIAKSYEGNSNVLLWKNVRWDLLMIYISGCFNNLGNGVGGLRAVSLLFPYFIFPHRFLRTPTAFKRQVIKYLIGLIFRSKACCVTRFIYSFRKCLKLS